MNLPVVDWRWYCNCIHDTNSSCVATSSAVGRPTTINVALATMTDKFQKVGLRVLTLALLFHAGVQGSSLPSIRMRRVPFSQKMHQPPPKSDVDTECTVRSRNGEQLFSSWAKDMIARRSAVVLGVPSPLLSRLVLITSALAGVYQIASSEATQRAFYFWKEAGPIVVHYKFTQVSKRKYLLLIF